MISARVHPAPQVQSQGQKVVNADVIWKGLVQRICISNMTTIPCKDQRLLTTWTFGELQGEADKYKCRQTDKQTERQLYNNISSVNRSWVIKLVWPRYTTFFIQLPYFEFIVSESVILPRVRRLDLLTSCTDVMVSCSRHFSSGALLPWYVHIPRSSIH